MKEMLQEIIHLFKNINDRLNSLEHSFDVYEYLHFIAEMRNLEKQVEKLNYSEE
jgi:hypothetical protein